jgi:dTDP-4-dehydrorhamnose 3,5-epimerase
MNIIDGVKTKKLKVIPDERGRLMEILRNDEELFSRFGQVYVTTTYPGTVKAWHFHKKQTDNVCAVQGMIKLVLYDARKDSSTKGQINEFYIGIHNPLLVQIPEGIYHGWMCISENEAVIINCPTELYDYKNPDEFRIAPHGSEVPYDWKRKDG